MSFSKVLLFNTFCSSLFVFQLSVHKEKGKDLVKQRVDRSGKRRGLKIGKDVRTSFIDDYIYRPVHTGEFGSVTPPGTISVGTGPNVTFLSANKQTCHLRR